MTDDDGASSTLVEEILVDLPAAPTVHTGGASGTVVHGAVSLGEPGHDLVGRVRADRGVRRRHERAVASRRLRPAPGERGAAGAQTGRLYHYRLVADNATGSASGEDRVFVAGSSPGSDAYRDAALGTAGLANYWRLGELSGGSSSDESSAATGPFAGRYVLGQPGVLGPLGNTSASFDGASGELSMPGSQLGANATLEGWFRWRSGTTVLRDTTDMGGEGWLLAFATGGKLAYRLGGQGFNTGLPIETVRDGEWHHIAATKSGTAAALYVDGEAVALVPDRRGLAARGSHRGT